MIRTAILAVFLLSTFVSAQLSGNVGPTTTRTQKRTKVCNVMDYGAVASKTSDIGPPLTSAFAACKSGGTVYVPPGDYGMSTWVTLSGGNAWAFQLDGTIYRVGTQSGNMIVIENANDFEMYSSTSAGAIQAYGYVFHAQKEYGARIIRLVKCNNFSLHDIALVDAPQFHLFLDTCTNGEVYNVIIRGGNEGGLDGVDVTGSNIWVHDVEVTNKDECVTVKSPSHNILVENIYCNWSGGCAMGSLGTGTDISNILYRNVYTWQSNQMYMLKSNGGSGTVTNCTFENFIGHSNAYSLDLNSYWSSEKVNDGSGVEYSNLKFKNWKGTCANGGNRAPINIVCPTSVPCTGITIDDFSMWTDEGSEVLYKCENAYGSGGCLAAGTGSGASKTMTMAVIPTSYSAPKMSADLSQGFAVTASIPIPAIPTSFFPGTTPASRLLGGAGTNASRTITGRWNH